VYGGLTVIEMLCVRHNLRGGSLRFGLDGDKAMEQSKSSRPLSSKQPSFDLLSAIRSKVQLLLSKYKVEVQFFWVEGHQREKHGSIQDYEGEVNDLADGLAKGYLASILSHPPVPTRRFAGEGWSLHAGGLKQSNYDKDFLYNYTYGGSESRDYWHQRHLLTDASSQAIAWQSLDEAMAAWPWGKRKWLMKQLAGFSATGRVMQRRREWTHDRCPVCDQPDENSMHCWFCTGLPAVSAFEEALTTFSETLTDLDTAPLIKRVMLTRLRSVRSAYPYFVSVRHDQPVYEATLDQDAIGWAFFLMGRLSTKWLDAQDAWLRRQHTRYKSTASAWARQVIVAVLEIGWHLWENRNKFYHSPDHPWKRAVRSRRQNLIEELFAGYDPAHFHRADRWYFEDNPLNALLAADDDAHRNWLRSVQQAYYRRHGRDTYNPYSTRGWDIPSN